MALISKRKGRKSGSGYERILGDAELGELISKVHATSISAGTELEKLIQEQSNVIENLDEWLKNIPQNGCYLAPKRVLKKSRFALKKNEPDMLVFKIIQLFNQKHCSVIEAKDGDQFDTKKAEGEIEHLKKFRNHIAPIIPFTTSIHVCSFNQQSKQKIVEGFKNKITRSEAMTGKELCKLLGISYTKIINERKKDQKRNLNYLFKNFMSANILQEKIKNKIEKAVNKSQIEGIKKLNDIQKDELIEEIYISLKE